MQAKSERLRAVESQENTIKDLKMKERDQFRMKRKEKDKYLPRPLSRLSINFCHYSRTPTVLMPPVVVVQV